MKFLQLFKQRTCMTNDTYNGLERRKPKAGYEGKYFILGTFFAVSIIITWFSSLYIQNKIVKLDNESFIYTNNHFINFISGKWNSGDEKLFVDINFSGENIIIRTNDNIKYLKINKINKIDSYLGIIVFEVCDIKTKCQSSDFFNIQINKIFDTEKLFIIVNDKNNSYENNFSSALMKQKSES